MVLNRIESNFKGPLIKKLLKLNNANFFKKNAKLLSVRLFQIALLGIFATATLRNRE